MLARRSVWWLWLLLVALVLPSLARAEPSERRGPTRDAARSVYRVSLRVDLPVTAVAALGVLVPYAESNPFIRERCPCDPQDVNRFDRRTIGRSSDAAYWIASATVGLGIAAPVALDVADLGFTRTLLEDLVVFAETIAVNGAFVTATKYIVQRPLPRTYAGERSFEQSPEGYRSFYSGHTSTLFAALSATSMTLRLRYGEQGWPWVGTALIGTSVGFELVHSGRHFPTDVILGAAMGTLVGIAVPWLHARPRSFARGFFATPVPSGASLGWATLL